MREDLKVSGYVNTSLKLNSHFSQDQRIDAYLQSQVHSDIFMPLHPHHHHFPHPRIQLTLEFKRYRGDMTPFQSKPESHF